MTVDLSGVLQDDKGIAISSKDAELYDVDTTTPVRATDTTDSNGEWDFNYATPGLYDVKIINGNDIHWIRGRDKFNVAKLMVLNSTANQYAGEFIRTEDVASIEVALFEGNRATPAAGDAIYNSFKLSDSAGNQDEFARVTVTATDETSTTEDGTYAIDVAVAGSLATALSVSATGATGSIIKDEDDMSSDSNTHLATQQSIKKYVDDQQDTVDTWAEVLALGNTSGATDVIVSNGQGLVIGHTAQITEPQASEFQVLGTAGSDSSAIFGRWGANTNSARVSFVKSRDPVIFDGTYAIVADNDEVGAIDWFPDDGVDLSTRAAQFLVEVDDGSPAAGDIGTAFVWSQMPGGGGAIAETMRLDAAASLTLTNGADRTLIAGQTSDATTYNVLSFNGDITAAGHLGILGGATGDDTLFLSTPTGGNFDLRVNEVSQMNVNVTRTLLNGYLVLDITDTDSSIEGALWYDASEDKLKFKTAAGVETITSS